RTEIEWERSEAHYFFVSARGGFERVEFSGQTLRDRWDEFTELLCDLTESITSGDFHPEPNNGNTCRYCDFADVCDAQIARLAERKAGSRAERFIRLIEVE